MKKKSFLIVILSLLTVLSFPAAANETTGKKITEYTKGALVEFGYYPQSEVTDTKLKTTLTGLAGNTDTWTSYGYYSGTGTYNNGQMTPSGYMVYKNVTYNNNKYRGVFFTKYRPNNTGLKATETPEVGDNNFQQRNGYEINTIYWFRFDPIQWRVLDPANGLVVSEILLDAQPYNNYVLYESVADSYNNYTYWGNVEKTSYANNYANSSIRAWLNDDFRNTAFCASQQDIIAVTSLDNSAYDISRSAYAAVKTEDKIFLLSWKDALNTDYGFTSSQRSTATRKAGGSAYAKMQGLSCDSAGNGPWTLRTAGQEAEYPCGIVAGGDVYPFCPSANGDCGIRPALCFNLSSVIFQVNVTESGTTKITDFVTGNIIQFGYYPQSEVKDAETKDILTRRAGKTDTWTSYEYYSGSGSWNDGSMTPSDYMVYQDVIYNNNKYRGVFFTDYRPTKTSLTGSSNNQQANGYSKNTIYWFKFEPIQWRVLNPVTGLVMSEKILDSQPYHYYILAYGNDWDGYWGNSERTFYPNNYEYSSIRAWLNDDFYNTAFGTSQQDIIATTTLDNSAYTYSYSKFNANNTNDKIFLLSWNDVLNKNYGFTSNNQDFTVTRQTNGSAYAIAQGLNVGSGGLAHWELRSAGCYAYTATEVHGNGFVYYGSYTNDTSYGIRPALSVNPSSVLVQTKEKETVFYGDIDGKNGVTAADARLALRASVKLETLTDAQNIVADVDGKNGVTAKDARLILRYAVKLENSFPVDR